MQEGRASPSRPGLLEAVGRSWAEAAAESEITHGSPRNIRTKAKLTVGDTGAFSAHTWGRVLF